MDTQDYIQFLHELEDEHDFHPWDDEEHAAKNLQTVFDLHPEYANAIVKLAGVSTIR